MSKKEKISLIIIFVLALIVIAGGIYFWQQSRKAEFEKILKKDSEQNKISVSKKEITSHFADFEKFEVKTDPKVKNYSIESDFGNVMNFENFRFDEKEKDLLRENKFLVRPADHRNFNDVYENNSRKRIPNFITSDSVLHNFDLFFNYLLAEAENEKLFDILSDLTGQMLQDSKKQYEELAKTDWQNAAKRNIAFFQVAEKILNKDAEIDERVKDEVDSEIQLIRNHQGIRLSNVVNIGQNIDALAAYREDYSEYEPKGHYAKNEKLENYFQAISWFSRINWRLGNAEETKSAILMTKILKNNNEIFKNWEKIFSVKNFFAGLSGALTFYDYDLILDQNFPQDNLIAENKVDEFSQIIENLNRPQITVISDLSKENDEQILSWKFFTQNQTPDRMIFNSLTESGAEKRNLPKALDIAAVFSSDLAKIELERQKDFEFENYENNFNEIKEKVGGLDEQVWTQNFYWTWMYVAKALIEPVGRGYPDFMNNQAWQFKDLQTFLSAWTELKHNEVLPFGKITAKKESQTENDEDVRGYVEPRAFVYARLASLTKMIGDGLKQRDLLGKDQENLMKEFENLALTLKKISEKELNNEKLSDNDYEFIENYDEKLNDLWRKILKRENAEDGELNAELALAIDMFGDTDGNILTEAIGYVDEIYVIFPVSDKLKIGKGGVFSHYEFVRPAGERLTDEIWRQKLKNGKIPAKADWHNAFLAD